MRRFALFFALFTTSLAFAQKKSNVVDEVIWVVGDDPILLSEVEDVIWEYQANRMPIEDPYCKVPEQLAIQKLFLHQADLDSIEVGEADVINFVNELVNNYLQVYGSKENLEASQHKTLAQFREMLKRSQRDKARIQQERKKITENVKVTPAEVREYFKNLPTDSLPVIPEQVEVQIITAQPQPTREEVMAVEDKLRDFAKRVKDGESEFSTLARFYSQDPGSARNGGELEYMGKNQFVPEFSNVAFSLNEPGKVSKIVKTEYGYHLIQLIDKMGDKVKVRHILLIPEIADSIYSQACTRLDSIASDIRSNKYEDLTFDMAAGRYSDDKDTKKNNGLLFYKEDAYSPPTSRIEMKNLNQDIAKVVDTLKVGEISKAFVMTNDKGQKVCAIVKLKNRIESHPASISEDFQTLRDVVYEKRCEAKLEDWVKQKIKDTYVRIKPEWRNCTFTYDGWIKQ